MQENSQHKSTKIKRQSTLRRRFFILLALACVVIFFISAPYLGSLFVSHAIEPLFTKVFAGKELVPTLKVTYAFKHLSHKNVFISELQRLNISYELIHNDTDQHIVLVFSNEFEQVLKIIESNQLIVEPINTTYKFKLESNDE